MLGERLLRPSLVGVAKKKVQKMRKKTIKISKNYLVEVKNTHIGLNKRNINNEQSNWNRFRNH